MTDRDRDGAAPIPLDAPMIASITAVAAVAVAFTIVAAIVAGMPVALSVAVGGLLATANLWVFAIVGKNVIAGGRRRRIWGLVGGLKLLALLGGLYLLLENGVIDPLPLVIGYGALPLGIAIGSVFGPRPGDDGQPTSGSEPDLLNAGPTREASSD